MHKTPGKNNTEVEAMSVLSHSGILEIDLHALQNNYLKLQKISSGAECAAVLKANAYGLGMEQVAPALCNIGCKSFFVANLAEALKLRNLNNQVDIYVLNGFIPDFFKYYQESRLIPVISSLTEAGEWQNISSKEKSQDLTVALQVNTGMNRLGMSLDKNTAKKLQDQLNIQLLLSHLACADEPDHPANGQQLNKFLEYKNLFPNTRASLCNSAGIFHGADFHFDLVRPGIALYGGKPQNIPDNPMETVVTLHSRVIQIEHVPEEDFIGYGAAQHTKRNSRIATLSFGYADGYLRSLSSSSSKTGGKICINGSYAPIIGRISMDLITIDITDIPEHEIKRGDMVEIIGPNITLDDVADTAATISYEILTSLGNRYKRVYKNLKD